ncbi:MAG: hypothetical protein KC643_00645 [Nitrospira sp.]|nr:hypothetical protein [Nitrospira sp.]
MLPYSWFLALEQWNNRLPFLEDQYLENLGLIPDHNPQKNPDHLPVGFAKSVDPIGKDTWVGLTCAACHTLEFRYQNAKLRVDGGPSFFDAMKFAEELEKALAVLTRPQNDEGKFSRFATRVLKSGNNETVALLKKKVEKFLDVLRMPKSLAAMQQITLYPIEWGKGRLDALGRGGNTVLLKLHAANLRPADAPVSYPAIWDSWNLYRVQWNGAIIQPMGRNLLQALGLNANVIITSGPEQFRSSVNPKDLFQIETYIKNIRPPTWPSEIFQQPIDKARVVRGSILYEKHCAHCHVPKLTRKNDAGPKFKNVHLIPIDEIGTDPIAANNFNTRLVYTGPLEMGLLTASDTAEFLTTKILERSYGELHLSENEKQAWNGFRPNQMKSPLAYVARPHSGVWALAPYLHNGSIPNLYQLLSTKEERDDRFYIGNREFDPIKVGFVTTRSSADDFLFDTSIPGNSKAGHEFRDGPRQNGVIGPKLSEEEKWNLIEFLKTL